MKLICISNKQKLKIILFISLFLIFFILIFFILKHKNYDIEKTFVDGNSMSPNFYNQETIYLYKNYYTNYKDVGRGDVIGFTLKNKGNFIKRIIAIPQDKVIFGKDGYIYINNKKQEEKYIKTTLKFNMKHIKLLLTQLEYYNNIIPEKMFLVMGDNRLSSIDSSFYGLIDYDHILGKVFRD